MRSKVLLALILFCGLEASQSQNQASPYTNSLFKPQIFTSTGQTGAVIQLNGLIVPSTIGSSFASGTITLTGTALTTVTFAVQGSSDNGVTYFAIPVSIVASPGSTPSTSPITATANGLYQVNLTGLTHIKFATSGTFTATSVSLVLSASPNGMLSRGPGGGSSSGVASIDNQTGAFTFGGAGVSHSGNAYTFSGGGAAACPLATSATELCVTSSPYNASTAGLTTTTNTSTFAVGASGTIGSCSTFLAGNGVLIAGAGAAGANYIGKVVSCSGTTLSVTPSTSTSVASGHVIQHDESAAFNAAVTALASTGGTIFVPDGTYLLNGPLQNGNGQNAIVSMPGIPYFNTPAITIFFQGMTWPGLSITKGAVIQTSLATGNIFGGNFTGSESSPVPFTAVWLRMENFTFVAPSNPGVVMVNATNIAGFKGDHLTFTVASVTPPSNTAGAALLLPIVGNNDQSTMDDGVFVGYYTGLGQIGEHSVIGRVVADTDHDCYTFDLGTPTGFGVGSSTVINMAAAHCVHAISAGVSQPSYLNILQADFDPTNTVDVFDPNNFLNGWLKYKVGSLGSTHTPATITGATNLCIRASQWPSDSVCPQEGTGGSVSSPVGLVAGLLENWISQEGQGTALENSGYDFTNKSATTAVTWATAAGFTGKVATYNGTSSFSQATSATNTAFDGSLPFSACVWFNPTTLAPFDQYLMSNQDTTGGGAVGWGFELYNSSGALKANISNNNTSNLLSVAALGLAATVGQANLGCMTYNGSKAAAGLTLYMNGVAGAPTVAANTLTGSTVSTQPVVLGMVGSAGLPQFAFFQGAIGRARVYNRLLSASEISAMFAAGPSAF